MNEQDLYKDKVPSSDLEDSPLFSGEVVEGKSPKAVIIPDPPFYGDPALLKKEKQIMPIDAQALIIRAIDQNLDVDKLERLLEMRERLRAEAAKDSFFRALSEFQADCPVIEKTKIVYNKKPDFRGNKTVRYKYAPLDEILTQVKDLLKQHGFSYVIKSEQSEGNIIATCVLHHIDGHEEETSFPAPVFQSEYMNNIQKVASALTYAKRYAFCNATGILTGDEDDDSNVTEEDVKPQKQKPKKDTWNPEAKKGLLNSGFSEAPEENRAIYSAIMAILREDLLTPEEKANIKKNADTILFDYDALKEFAKSVNKTVNVRREQKKKP